MPFIHRITILTPSGDNGIRVWSFPEGDPIQVPDFNPETMGQITSIKWVNEERECARLVVGTGLGNVLLWKYDAAEVCLTVKEHRVHLQF
jgi:WD40 repeat protein